jgi:hypothetical protein
MHHNIHKYFILSPITDILRDAVSASAGVGNGIQTFPLWDYVMQSVFIKMTGFQEQKMKCICWEIATYDYDYRYKFSQEKLGECSNYKDKQKIYQDLIIQIEKNGLKFDDINTKDNKKEILSKTKSEIKNIFSNTNLLIWGQKYFNNYESVVKDIKFEHFMNDKVSLFSDAKLKKMYVYLYDQRNRIAHNATSYQQNLPTLKTLIEDDYKYNNYFLYFAILILIDGIFIQLYKKYLVMLNSI